MSLAVGGHPLKMAEDVRGKASGAPAIVCDGGFRGCNSDARNGRLRKVQGKLNRPRNIPKNLLREGRGLPLTSCGKKGYQWGVQSMWHLGALGGSHVAALFVATHGKTKLEFHTRGIGRGVSAPSKP